MPESQQTSDYPGALDTWVTVDNKEDLVEESDINKIKAAIEAVQTEIGTDPAGTLATLKARLAIMMATSGALAQGTSFPVSPTPVEGQVFYRTDANTPYVYDGADWNPFVATSYQIFTTSGSFVVPGGITRVYLTMVGGGAGGSSNYTTSGGGGGGGGCSLINYPFTVTPLASLTVTIGAGGAGGAGGAINSGANGGDTSFDSVSVGGGAGASGGSGGAAGTNGSLSGSNASSGTGGAGGSYGISGGLGGNGSATGSTSDGGGGGGGSYFGEGGAGGSSSAGGNGLGFGSGGGGATEGGYGGGNGSSGFVLVSW